MRTTNFDAIATAAPLDRQASVVRDASGDLFEGKVPIWHVHWTAPPLPEGSRPRFCPDMTGAKAGRLTVVRYHRSHPKKGAQWLVRCVCGDYELRCTAALKTPHPDHKCEACAYFEKAKRWREEGRAGLTTAKADGQRLDDLAAKARAA